MMTLTIAINFNANRFACGCERYVNMKTINVYSGRNTIYYYYTNIELMQEQL